MVAAVPITPIFPFFVAAAAARALGPMTSMLGHGEGFPHAAGHGAHRAAGSQHRLYVLREEKVHVWRA